jgi:hypothetical protein
MTMKRGGSALPRVTDSRQPIFSRRIWSRRAPSTRNARSAPAVAQYAPVWRRRCLADYEIGNIIALRQPPRRQTAAGCNH